MKYLKELNLYYESALSCAGSPCGYFTNKTGQLIAVSSYDKIIKITAQATKKQREYFNKYMEVKK